MYKQSELDCDHDICGECQECGQEVHEAGSTICDNCDPERQADYWHDIDDSIEFCAVSHGHYHRHIYRRIRLHGHLICLAPIDLDRRCG